MRLATDKAERATKAAGILAAVILLSRMSAALQTSIPATPTPRLPNSPRPPSAGSSSASPIASWRCLKTARSFAFIAWRSERASTPSPVGAFTDRQPRHQSDLLPQGTSHRRRRKQSGRLPLDGPERKGLRHPRNQPAELDRQGSFDRMHSHGQRTIVEELFDAGRSRRPRFEIRAERDEQIAADLRRERRDADHRAGSDRSGAAGVSSSRFCGVAATRLACRGGLELAAQGGKSWKQCCKVW